MRNSMIIERFTRCAYGNTVNAWWLLCDGVPVGYTKTIPDYYNGYPVICDIEIREGHRGNGHAGVLLRHIAQVHNVDKVLFSGSFTPEGFEAFAGQSWCESKPQANTSSMTFVDDWDSKRTKWDCIDDEIMVWEIP